MTDQGCEPGLLDVAGVSRRFATVQALDDVSLRAAHGEVLCLVGPSGCGKTTLLRVVAGIEPVDSGRVSIDGTTMSSPERHAEPESRGIGFMFQDYALFPHLNVVDNILFGLRRLARPEARTRCAGIMGRLGLDPLADRFPHALSGGEQQRVALARALAPRPRILLMDEPFSNLDRGLRAGIRGETLALLRELGTTVVMVTHDPEEAFSAGDQVVLMRAGRVVQAGTASDLYERPANAYAAGFFSSLNRIGGRCRDGVLDTPLGRFPAPGIEEGATADAFVRPHLLRIVPDGEGVGGTVLVRSFAGEIEHLELALDGLAEPLQIRSTLRSPLRVGDRARVAVDPGHVFVFAAA